MMPLDGGYDMKLWRKEEEENSLCHSKDPLCSKSLERLHFRFFFQLVSLFLWPADFHSSVFIYLFIYLFSPSFFSVTKKKKKSLVMFCLLCDLCLTSHEDQGNSSRSARGAKVFYFSILTKRNRRRAAEETSHSQPKIGVHKNPLIFSAISSLLFLPRFWCAGDDDDGLKSFFSLIIADCIAVAS